MTAPLRLTRQQAAAETKMYRKPITQTLHRGVEYEITVRDITVPRNSAVTRDQIKHAAATLRVVVTKKYEADLPMTSEWMK